MSVKIMGAVWDANLPRREKYVLLAYADHAAHDGTSVYPSVDRTAWKTGYSDRSIHKITAKLVNRGILIEVGRRGHGVKEYRIDVTMLPTRESYRATPEESSEVQGDEEPTPEESSPQPPKNLRSTPEESSDKPSVNRHDESSSPKGAQAPDSSPPTSYQGWLDFVREEKNKPAALRWMIETIYDYYTEDELPEYGYIGKVMNRLGGPMVLAEKIWDNARYKPQGNLLDWIQKSHSNGGQPYERRKPKQSKELTEGEKARREWRRKQIEQVQQQWRE